MEKTDVWSGGGGVSPLGLGVRKLKKVRLRFRSCMPSQKRRLGVEQISGRCGEGWAWTSRGEI